MAHGSSASVRCAATALVAALLMCIALATEIPPFAADLVSERTEANPRGDSPQPAALVNHDGTVLPLFDPYAILGGRPSHGRAIFQRFPVWWPAQFRAN